jgi:hypothetical protein
VSFWQRRHHCQPLVYSTLFIIYFVLLFNSVLHVSTNDRKNTAVQAALSRSGTVQA